MLIPKVQFLLLFVAALLTVVAPSCTSADKENDLASLDRDANDAMSTPRMEGVDSLGSLLLERARQAGNKKYEGRAHFYLSALTPGLSEKEIKAKLEHLDRAERIAEETQNDTLLVRIYNQRGVYELSTLFNVSTAQYWFARSIEKAAGLKNRTYSIPAEMNMSEACRMIGDTLGIKYDLNLFDYALKTDNKLLKFLAGLHCAVYYAGIVNDTADLHRYIKAMEPLQQEYHGAREMVYAKYFLAKGDYREAEKFISAAHPDNYTVFQILYAEILNKSGKYRESEQWAQKAMPVRNGLSFNEYGKMLRIRAANMAALGDYQEAFRRQAYYEELRDSADKQKSLDLSRRYQTEYKVAAKDREIMQQKSHIRNMTILISAIIFVVVVAALAYYLRYRRRKRFYRDIVRQNKEFIERQNIMQERLSRRDSKIKELESSITDSVTRQSKISEEKADEIFDRIQHLADERQVWRDVNITREAFADMAGCNRTYFSEVLKAKTGMSYSQFVNSCRIREAVRILSDPSDTTSLKELSSQLGFLTIQTFYTSFKQNIGMSPAAFRKTAVAGD